MAKYLIEERETIVTYDPITRKWSAWTNVPEHIRKLQAKGWSMKLCHHSDGAIIDAAFEAPKNAITFRDLTKPKRTPTNGFNRIKTEETDADE